MKLYHIAALSENNVIGKGNDIPWSLPSDMRRFASITRGHTVIMGSNTFKSLQSPLRDRINIVVSHADAIFFRGKVYDYAVGEYSVEVELENSFVVFVKSIEDALIACEDVEESYIIGGGSIYQQTLDLVDELRLTIVHREIEKDETCVYYPEIDEKEWSLSFVETGETHSYVDYVRSSTR